jgi:prepilin-type N-terminal cleavage/methylation domain-containing protein
LGRERGVTLVELLLTIAILSVITGVLASVFITTTRSTVGVQARYEQSHDAQIASAYLATDVQSNATLTNTACGSGGTAIINFGYADGSVATYWYGASGGENRLTRVYCVGGNVTSTAILVHNGGGNPALTCDGGACSVGAQPNKVAISIPEHATGVSDYTYSLSGSRRACVNTVPGTSPPTVPCSGSTSSPPPPAPYGLIALNNGKVSVGGQGHLTLNAPGVIDSTACDAMSIQGNGRVVVSSVLAIRRPVPDPCPSRGCTGCTAPKLSPPSWTSFTDPVIDPFAGLPYPDEAGLPVYTNGVYQGPGVYRTMPLSLKATVNLAAGTYILEAGMSVSGKDSTITGTDVLLFNGCGRNSGGFCTAGTGSGQFDLSGQDNVFQLTPVQSGQYQYLLMWQPTLNTQPITIAGGGNVASLLKGIVYAPGSSGLSMGAGTAALQIWCVAGTSITLTGQGTVIIGQ